ncbi:MAG: hypothetical protein KDJ31_14465 [Candidatus Competibacteraceae bacterium]|nr:hypothetical protein [Candidatus Competibacteraceae bacterium]
MPFTPLHRGPGLAIKALAGRRFSLLTFGIAQVAMDIEPLIGLDHHSVFALIALKPIVFNDLYGS